MTLREALDEIPDPRARRGLRHPLGAILSLAVCAMLTGSRSLYAIAQWGRDEGSGLAEALGFTRSQTPCVATLHRVFRRLDREAFETRLGQWFQEHGLEPGEALALDGKTLRGIHGEQLPGVHLVSAYAHHTGIVVGQQSTSDKGNELAAAWVLLERLPLHERVVTGDAQFTQRNLSELTVEKGGTTSG